MAKANSVSTKLKYPYVQIYVALSSCSKTNKNVPMYISEQISTVGQHESNLSAEVHNVHVQLWHWLDTMTKHIFVYCSLNKEESWARQQSLSPHSHIWIVLLDVNLDPLEEKQE